MSSSAPEMAESSRARAGQEGEQEPGSSEPQPQRKWVALVSDAVPLGGNEDERVQKIALGTDALALLDLHDPPQPSYLMLQPRVAPVPRRTDDRPLSAYILAADDRAGRILLQVVEEGSCPNLYLCDTHTRTVTTVPWSFDIRRDYSIGLIADPRNRGHYAVVQLHPTTSKEERHFTKLLCYSTADQQWSTRKIDTPQQDPWCHPFSENFVLAHGGRLWWIALACGVFFCDPFDELPQLRFVPFPDDCRMEGYVRFHRNKGPRLRRYRCVRPSKGKLRLVEISDISYSYIDDAPPGPAKPIIPRVQMWTLNDPEGEGPSPWKREFDVRFDDIWKNDADAGLPRDKVPRVALVDPNNHYVVYFFQGSKLFGVDMLKSKVVTCKECLDPDQLVFQTSRPIVDAWVLPSPSPPTPPGDDDSSPDDADSVPPTESEAEEMKHRVTVSDGYSWQTVLAIACLTLILYIRR